jgi:hypothetical protein
MSPYTPDPGSVASRALALFTERRTDAFTHGQLCMRFDVTPNQLRDALAEPMKHGLVTFDKQGKDISAQWRAGPQLAAWLKNPAATPTAPPAPPAKKKGGVVKLLPAIDVTKLVVRTGVAKPAVTRRGGGRKGSRYDSVFALLKDKGQSTDLDIVFEGALKAAAAKAKKRGLGTFSVRSLTPTTCTIWRDA